MSYFFFQFLSNIWLIEREDTSYNFPKFSNIHTPPPIWLIEREQYKVTTKITRYPRLLVLGRWEKEKKVKMHALKKMWNQWLTASLAYSVKDCKGTEIKSVKGKKEKEKRDRNWEAFFCYIKGITLCPRFWIHNVYFGEIQIDILLRNWSKNIKKHNQKKNFKSWGMKNCLFEKPT